MKKLYGFLVVFASVVVVSEAVAFPIEAHSGEKAVAVAGYPSSLRMESDTVAYDSFCIQPGVSLYSTYSYDSYGNLVYRPYTVETVDEVSNVINPAWGVSEDAIDNIKWLYAAYQENVFDKIDYASMGMSSVGQVVQYGIWHLEKSQNSWTASAWSELSTYLDATTNNWSIYEAAGWEVKGVELSYNTAYGYTYAAQNQLVGWKQEPSSEVPEPATMTLFGLGLLGFAGVARKRNKK